MILAISRNRTLNWQDLRSPSGDKEIRRRLLLTYDREHNLKLIKRNFKQIRDMGPGVPHAIKIIDDILNERGSDTEGWETAGVEYWKLWEEGTPEAARGMRVTTHPYKDKPQEGRGRLPGRG